MDFDRKLVWGLLFSGAFFVFFVFFVFFGGYAPPNPAQGHSPLTHKLVEPRQIIKLWIRGETFCFVQSLARLQVKDGESLRVPLGRALEKSRALEKTLHHSMEVNLLISTRERKNCQNMKGHFSRRINILKRRCAV